MLASTNKHQYNHTYGIDLSLLMNQNQMAKQDKTCNLCCLFTLDCLHQFQSLNYSNFQQNRNEKNYNAILSSIDIWKENSSRNAFSPFYDVPICFHNNFSSSNQQILSIKGFESEQHLYSIKKTASSSYERLLHCLPSPPKTRISQRSSIDNHRIEPIKLIDNILNEQNQLITSSSSSILTKLSTTHQACSCLFYYCKSKKHLLFSRIYLFSKLQSKNSILSSSSSSSSSFDLDYSQPKRQKLSEKLSSTQPQTKLIDNKCNQTSCSISQSTYVSESRHENGFPQITISQFIKDIKRNLETSIDSPAPKLKLSARLQSKYSPNKFQKSSSITFTNKNNLLKSSIFPTVPKCLNEYSQLNFNSLQSKNSFKLNLFDSSLFQWEIFNKNQNQNYFCRNNSSLFISKSKHSIKSFLNFIQSQRQYVPLEYSSWNISFSDYQPLNFSLKKRKNLNQNSTIKNPYGRTGLSGQSLFDNYGPNRYIISLIITEKTNKKFILLNKNKFDKWELPKTKKLKKKNIHYHTLDVCYLDHPLNTDDAWTEVEIILISKNPFKFFHGNKTWFSMKYLDKLNNIEKFDFDLIEFYT
ncbi:unnamed protein product [Rotaria socialis]|uniref:Uncharacterized protein n=1 Tax=Rotaria socialis TaxID=392032 RepID=A0A820TTN7_9BILA|nr:unnamed protein product [Rotaria socialis]CAF4472112.1 unnamed protein product [Rotaria socialis]